MAPPTKTRIFRPYTSIYAKTIVSNLNVLSPPSLVPTHAYVLHVPQAHPTEIAAVAQAFAPFGPWTPCTDLLKELAHATLVRSSMQAKQDKGRLQLIQDSERGGAMQDAPIASDTWQGRGGKHAMPTDELMGIATTLAKVGVQDRWCEARNQTACSACTLQGSCVCGHNNNHLMMWQGWNEVMQFIGLTHAYCTLACSEGATISKTAHTKH